MDNDELIKKSGAHGAGIADLKKLMDDARLDEAQTLFKEFDKWKRHKVKIWIAGIKEGENCIWIPQKEYEALKKKHLLPKVVE